MTATHPGVTETTTLPCAVCLKPLERIDGDAGVPYAANIFTTHGHYGATAFDSVCGGEHLELLICTDCMTTMRSNAAIHRVLKATEAVPEQTFIWGSAEDPDEDNAWNKLRLSNDFAMEAHWETADDMTQERAKHIYDAGQEASRAGMAFNPAATPAPTN
jgi:hypothetical protein